MLNALVEKFFGTRNERLLAKLQPLVAQINGLESSIAPLTDDALKNKTTEFRARLADGELLDNLLPEAFAVVRETAKRQLGERHYDVQLLGGMVLHQGKIAEMRTGEGKTLVSTLAVYLNALAARGVHVITVNDYLAKRDADWMSRVYKALGLTVGCIQENMTDDERRAAYGCDITYGTNNQFGFDYLRDYMKMEAAAQVHRPFHFAIIDEVDSVLIDEARTPLIISGPAEDTSALYLQINALMPQLLEEDFERDEKVKAVTLTDSGVEKLEALLRQNAIIAEHTHLYDIENVAVVHHVNQALRAHKLYIADKDYINKDGKIILIDEFTGRMMTGRRLSEGLHQAIEAKEGVTIQRENQTLASITIQNYFRLYPKLGGMTGTALTEAEEFAEIYGLDVVDIPTHRAVSRIDMDDAIYRSMAEKNKAIVALVKDCVVRQQPVLVGTTSIEKSEELSAQFKKAGIEHSVLNARQHEHEATIIAQAGRPGAVTIATNMAGRGTDIKLGGNADMLLATQLKGDETPEQVDAMRLEAKAQIARDAEFVKQAGGLFVLGTERHESRRIDNQLRGRSGRQGDNGTSKFFLSLEDDLMRIFGAQMLEGMLTKLGLREGDAIVHPWVNKAIERAQKKVEAHYFDVRRNLLKFDNVMNDQRKVIYAQRHELMSAENVTEVVSDMWFTVLHDIVDAYIEKGAYKEQWPLEDLAKALRDQAGLDLPLGAWAAEEGVGEDELRERIVQAADNLMAQKRQKFVSAVEQKPESFFLNPDMPQAERASVAELLFQDLERSLVLQGLDKVWKEHLLNLDHLRQGINLRAYAQRDPLNEYKAEAFALFGAMLEQYRSSVTKNLMIVDLLGTQMPSAFDMPQNMQLTRDDPALMEAMANNVVPLNGSNAGTGYISRNGPCTCGSGKKYKYCCGKL